MEREFEYQKQRNQLSAALRELRKNDANGKEVARDTLKIVKQSTDYIDNKTLHRAAQKLDKSQIEGVSSVLDVEDDPEKWDVVDLSNSIPSEIRRFIDSEIISLADGKNFDSRFFEQSLSYFGIEPARDEGNKEVHRVREELVKRANEFVDSLTGGRLLDPHNFNHVVTGSNVLESMKTFDRYSVITFRRNDWHFWVATGENAYVTTFRKPIVICSPYNPNMRRFLEEERDPTRDSYPIDGYAEFRRNFMAANELPNIPNNPGLEIPFKRSYARSANEGNGYSWMDIADCLVDLKAEKMWIRKYSEAEKDEVTQDIEAYRSGKKKI